MTIQDMLDIAGTTLQHNWFFIVIVLSLVQIAPIQISPWTWIGRWFGKIIGVKELSEKVDKLEYKVEQNEAITSRVRILRFGDEIRDGEILHSKESFDQVLNDITRYDAYCKEHPEFENAKTVLTTKVIKDTYTKLYEEHKI